MFAEERSQYGEMRDAEGRNRPIPLKAVSISGKVDDVLTTFTISQTYRNDREKPIEALYTFPIPVDAVFLGMEAQFGERRLAGVVMPSASAEKKYDKAIDDGNAAILLKEMDDGLYHASFGNLRPGETATVEYRYAMQHTWNDRFLRVHIPTAIAPRYGDPAKAGLPAAATPEYAATAFPRWQFSLDVTGAPAQCAISCPSHPLSITAVEHGLQVSLATLPDRDIVLDFESKARPESMAVCGRDRDGWIVAADFMPHFPEAGPSSTNLDILVDCSGSMSGPSMQQARAGLKLILDALGPGDFFNITAFGSSHKSLFRERRPADEGNLATARRFVGDLSADMGGTEAASALAHVYGIPGGEGPRSVLFITDGEIWSGDKLYDKARASGCRIMTVGVGCAVSEKTVRRLADVTGGKCELVSPDEDMARRIHRHCMRIARPAVEKVSLVAAGADNPEQRIPSAVYDGDTVHVFARYADKPSGEIRLQASMGGKTLSWTCAIPETAANAPTDGEAPHPTDLARMAAADRLRRLRDKDGEKGRQLAVDYQLLSRWTSCVLVDERADGDKADTLPESVKVPHMVAHGWGGGMVLACCTHSYMPRGAMMRGLGKGILSTVGDFAQEVVDKVFKNKSGSPASQPDMDTRPDLPAALGAFMRNFSENCAKPRADRQPMSSMADLLQLGLPQELADGLLPLVDDRLTEEALVWVLMSFLATGHADSFGMEARRWIERCANRIVVKAAMRRKVRRGVDAWLAMAG